MSELPERHCRASGLCAQRLGFLIDERGDCLCEACGQIVRIRWHHRGGTQLEPHLLPRVGSAERWERLLRETSPPSLEGKRAAVTVWDRVDEP